MVWPFLYTAPRGKARQEVLAPVGAVARARVAQSGERGGVCGIPVHTKCRRVRVYRIRVPPRARGFLLYIHALEPTCARMQPASQCMLSALPVTRGPEARRTGGADGCVPAPVSDTVATPPSLTVSR